MDEHTARLLNSRVGQGGMDLGHHVCQGLRGKARASISISIHCTRSEASFFCRVGLAWTKAKLGKVKAREGSPC